MELRISSHTKDSVQRYLGERTYPSLLLSGVSHLGKSLCASQIIREILGVDEKGLLSHPDFMELKDKSVDAVRKLREQAELKPVLFNKKVFLVDNAGELSLAAQNALLKILEDEGEHVLFIFISHTDERGFVLPTIKSRCTHIRFTQLLLDEPDEVLNLLSDGRVGVQQLYKESSLHNLCRDIVELFASERHSKELLPMLHLLKEKDAEEFFSSRTKEEVYLLVSFLQNLFLEAIKRCVVADACTSSLLNKAVEGIVSRYSYDELRAVVSRVEEFKCVSHSNKNDFFELIVTMVKE